MDLGFSPPQHKSRCLASYFSAINLHEAWNPTEERRSLQFLQNVTNTPGL